MPVVIKVINGVKRRVMINRKGQWKFLKGKSNSISRKRHTKSDVKISSNNPKKRRSRVRSIKSKRTSFIMAKKRKSVKRRGMFGALNKPLASGITYAFVQPVVSQFLNRFNVGIQDELVQILAAVVLKNVVKNPIVNNWANAAIIINTASLVSSFSGNFLSGILSPKTTAAAPVSNIQIIG